MLRETGLCMLSVMSTQSKSMLHTSQHSRSKQHLGTAMWVLSLYSRHCRSSSTWTIFEGGVYAQHSGKTFWSVEATCSCGGLGIWALRQGRWSVVLQCLSRNVRSQLRCLSRTPDSSMSDVGASAWAEQAKGTCQRGGSQRASSKKSRAKPSLHLTSPTCRHLGYG